MFRELEPSEFEAAARILDPRTAALRWLVAFLRNSGDGLSGEGRWALWWGGLAREASASWVAVARLRARTLYVGGDGETADATDLEALAREVSPLRVVGDASFLDLWGGRSAAPRSRASESRRFAVLAYRGGAEAVPGFRIAEEEDLPVLVEYARLLFAELGEPDPPDTEACVENGLVYVVEEAGLVAGMVFSNSSDGRYVHAGGAFVHPAHRGRGLGRRLAAGLGAALLAERSATAVLDADEENVAALAAYRAAGYEEIGVGRILGFPEGAWRA